ncbi:hypothetical protein LCGC14_1714170 [marine sediment metagenome]|uniref:Uncharacterized protein n=1 Tax=marine sediment metagenome TaxID=412755 RepID=A0A0F9KEC4_9ZZZZ
MKLTIIGTIGIIAISIMSIVFQDFASTTLGTIIGIVSIVLFGSLIYTEWKLEKYALDEVKESG